MFYIRPDGSKLDYYPTTGTIKTSINHPVQGLTQMFRQGLSESEFIKVSLHQAIEKFWYAVVGRTRKLPDIQQSFLQVLTNPRAHTQKGYQKK